MCKVTVKVATYLSCPNCQNDEAFKLHDVVMKDGSFGPWTCTDCHHAYSGKLEGDAWQLTFRGLNKPTLVLLSIPPQAKPVYFVVRSSSAEFISGNAVGSAERDENNRFYYEENCTLSSVIACESILSQERRGYSDGNAELVKYVGEVDMGELAGDEYPDSPHYIAAFAGMVPDFMEMCVRDGVFDEGGE
ncbi:MAG: hypothetical protein AB7W16_12755 [Candidatus Obscuribacterales bacterium]